jgi:hypothetical protein
MVVQVRAGKSMRSVAREHQISLSTVQWWMRRAADLPLERVDWRTHPSIATKIRRTDATIEDLVVSLRRELKETSDLGEYGARAIHRELVVRIHEAAPPSVRTVGRILERRGALDGKRRIRRTPPPPGWYLPEVSQRRVELDSFDIIEGFTLEGGVRLEALNVVSLHGGLPGSWPQTLVTAKIAVEALVEHWREFGLPRLRPVRQRHDLSRQPSWPGFSRPRRTHLSSAWRDSGVRPSPGKRLPGCHRKLQRPLARQSVAAFPSRFTRRPPAVLGALRRGLSPSSCRPHRSGSSATPLSRSLASGSPGSSSRSGDLHPPHL